ncbi:potassium channel family protein [Haloarcula litorea]|uniref:potassium channel family protein n=1 Tax=Haloarcula litorea TaxID=3032579 RepID=UPI0023E7F6E3|nr:NAD-binding protein [Halomicroarcula sp. GDY20]
MAKHSQYARYYLITVVGTIVVFTLAYDYGMTTLENRPQPLVNSFQVVFQTFTTVGYGEDAPWTSPIMNVLVMGMQVTGILLIFAALPVFVIPLIEDVLATDPPTAVDDVHGHVILCSYTRKSDALISELSEHDVDYVIVESDRETAVLLYEQGHSVVYGDPEVTETLRKAQVDTATAVVADASDEVNVSIVLAAEEATDEIYTISIIEDYDLADYHRHAGADRVFSPNQLLGERLVDKATTMEPMNLDDVVELSEEFEIVEVPIQPRSGLVGETLSENQVAERTGAALLGAWIGGEFTSPIPPETVLDGQTILLAVGRKPQLDRLKQLGNSGIHRPVHGHHSVVVAGMGEVGSAVTDALARAEIEPTTLDIEDKPSVDVTCNATNPEALLDANIETAQTVILALPDDTDAVFATLLVRRLNPEVKIIARANEADSIPKLYRAGADYVLALATVTGEMIAGEILPAGGPLSPSERVQIVHREAPKLAGQTLAESRVRTRTGVTVVAVERDGEIISGIDPSFTVRENDALLISGTQEEIEQFSEFTK